MRTTRAEARAVRQHVRDPEPAFRSRGPPDGRRDCARVGDATLMYHASERTRHSVTNARYCVGPGLTWAGGPYLRHLDEYHALRRRTAGPSPSAKGKGASVLFPPSEQLVNSLVARIAQSGSRACGEFDRGWS